MLDTQNKRPYDVTIYGATGFTGKQAAEKLWKAAQTYRLKLAIAGRSEEKLKKMRSELGSQAEREIGIFTADATDSAGLQKMAASTRVVVTTAGPFSKFGPELVKACVEQGADYVDITGETPFVRRMIDRHHDKARENKVRIVPFCGFDSVPSDLGAWFAINEWEKNHASAELDRVTTVFEARGGFNGGTIASAMEIFQDPEFLKASKDPNYLCPADGPRPRAQADITRSAPLPELDGILAPFFMSPINTRVVRRSQAMFENTHWKNFEYHEGMLLKGQLAPLAGKAVAGVQGVFPKLMGNTAGRKLIQALLPKPGEGPSEAQMVNGFMRVTTVAQGKSGETQITRIRAKGDPGNRITVTALTEAALCLLLEKEHLPERYGVLTPALAFEHHLYDRLKNQGFLFEVLKK
jgi:short subunit dehydrogenase-like uncharacterized protein